MAALAGIADESLRLYPDPSARRLRDGGGARASASTPEQVLAGNGSDDCLTILYRALPRPGRPRRLPVADLRPLRHAGVDPGRGAGDGCRSARSDAAGSCRADLGEQRAKMIIVANPNNPSATLVPVDELRRLRRRGRRKHRRRRRGLRRLRAGRRHRRQHAAVPGRSTRTWSCCARFSKSYSLAGARLGLLFASAPLVAEMNKVKDSYNVNAITQALGMAALEDRAYHDERVRGTLDERARLETRARRRWADLARVARRTSCWSRSASAPRRSTARSRAAGCWCAGGAPPSCARSCASPSASPTRTTA